MWNGELKRKIISLLQDNGFHPLPGSRRFNNIDLPIEDEEIPKSAFPEADFAGRLNETDLYVEVDTGEGVSHNLAKYFYVIHCQEQRPKKVLVLHILGPGFLESKHNYIFHRRLARFLSDKIKNTFEKEIEFHYEQSEPFLNTEDAVEWLSEKLREFTC